MTISLLVLLLAMAASAVLCIGMRNSKWIAAVMPACCAILLVLAVNLCVPVLNGETLDDGVFYIDSVSAIFMLLVALVGLMASIYSRAYIGLEAEEGKIRAKDMGQYYSLLIVFISVMMLTFTARSMAIVWLGIGATTLVSTFLVGFYSNEESTEAAWKYIILCSVGITIALAGYTLVYASTVGAIDQDLSLDWPALMAAADQLDPTLMKMAMVLIIVGFGTKVGLAPMHTWLPDAHSQAPSPISGLLSAVLLNCAMYGILRFYSVSEIVNPGFASAILLVFGLLSLAAAAFFIVSSRDLKRMLAYSSIENMGLIAIGLGIGSPIAIGAAIVQMAAHSVTKPILFFSAGNIVQSYGTRDMNSIRGVSKSMPFTSAALAIGTLAIVGAPPFAVFVGELSLMYASIDAGVLWVTVACVILLAIVAAGMALHIFPMLSGDPGKEIDAHASPSRHVPIAVLIACTLLLGLFMPDQVQGWLESAVDIITGASL
ncbi:MAG: hydrogenase 4 subunit F [Thermoplasmata archaeon]|nr:hydrogenase 4 subunit F [Thermoplasmata archaeon]